MVVVMMMACVLIVTENVLCAQLLAGWFVGCLVS
jgi:hypothetical protein